MISGSSTGSYPAFTHIGLRENPGKNLNQTIFSSEKRQKNTVVSPLSLSTVLSMVQQGSGGNTLKELDQVLHAQPKSTREGFKNLIQELSVGNCSLRTVELSGDLEDIKLEIANKLYVRTGFDILKSFVNIVKKDFRSDIEDLNFSDAASAADTINSWVSENTHHKIQSLVTKDMITPDTVLMLLNAVYFSGGWYTVFAERNTNMQPFTTLNGNSKDVATMHHYQEILVGGHNSDIGAKYVHLPFSVSAYSCITTYHFQNNQFSMLLIVPDAVDGLKGVLNSLTTQKLVSLIREVDTRYVDLALPKYKFDTTSKLVPTLKKVRKNSFDLKEEKATIIINIDLSVLSNVKHVSYKIGFFAATQCLKPLYYISQMGVYDLFDISANLTGISLRPLKATEVIQKAEIEVDEKGAKAVAVTGESSSIKLSV
ncbi:hypothetical protein ANN_19818 [Periplaneta americana]|uniref:Serpin domain-containing protein n=1 Tax=Periplaneta americana TaxID=6978 RepID=A0ABQ8SBK8_PERAM|nr:hypothetical protein ANN_19818 [Periplaneta americana]